MQSYTWEIADVITVRLRLKTIRALSALAVNIRRLLLGEQQAREGNRSPQRIYLVVFLKLYTNSGEIWALRHTAEIQKENTNCRGRNYSVYVVVTVKPARSCNDDYVPASDGASEPHGPLLFAHSSLIPAPSQGRHYPKLVGYCLNSTHFQYFLAHTFLLHLHKYLNCSSSVN
jgi:hypothetical protein